MEGQYVVFRLAGESYGIEIGRVQEIDRMTAITSVPEVPAFVEGVINLRGRIVSIVDLRTRFGLAKLETTSQSRIIVVRTGDLWVGLIVDSVSEVLRVSENAVEPPPAIASYGDRAFLQGIAKLEGRLVLLLDLERVLSEDVWDALLPA